MIPYLFTAIGFPAGGCDRCTCTKIGKGQLYIQKEKQNIEYTRMENKHTKQEYKHKKNIKNMTSN
jgi:hypothetical protein